MKKIFLLQCLITFCIFFTHAQTINSQNANSKNNGNTDLKDSIYYQTKIDNNGISVNNDRIKFPDGSLQTTAATNEWHYVTPTGGDDYQNIQNALNNFHNVSLIPGATYHLYKGITLGNNDAIDVLNIPVTTIVIFEAESLTAGWAAITMKGGSTLIGMGILQSSRYTGGKQIWNFESGKCRAGISIIGSRVNIEMGYIKGFEYGLCLASTSNDESDCIGYCNIQVGNLFNNSYNIYIYVADHGWVNGNTIRFKSLRYFGDYKDDPQPRFGVWMNRGANAINAINHNTFSGQMEHCKVGLYLSGKHNRFEGMRFEACETKIQIVDNYPGWTNNNYLFGEYGDISEWPSNSIVNTTGALLTQVLQIYGLHGDNYLNYVYITQLWTMGMPLSHLQSDNYKNINNSLDKLSLLNTISFETENSDNKSKNKEYGFNPEELEKNFPELVKTNFDSTYSINYMGLIPLLVEAIKEQKTIVDSLKTIPNNQNQKKIIDSLKFLLSDQQKSIDDLKLKIDNCCSLNQINNSISQQNIDKSNINLQSEIITINAILYQNQPNPFDKQTEIKYYIPNSFNFALINIYNLNGKQIKSFKVHQSGNGAFTINSYELEPGMYIYSLIIDNKEIDSKRMILTN